MYNNSRSLRSSWEGVWQTLDVENAHNDVLRNDASTNTMAYRPIIRRVLNQYERPNVLEAGCGLGQWLYYIAKTTNGTATGLDLAEDALSRVSVSETLSPFIKSKRVALQVGDMRSTPFDNSTFNLIFSFGVIEHVVDKDSARTIAEFARLLRPNGRLLVTTPNKFAMHSLTRPILQATGNWTVGFERSLTCKQLRNHVIHAGLEAEEYGVLDTGQLFGAVLTKRIKALEAWSHWIESRQKLFGFISYCIGRKATNL